MQSQLSRVSALNKTGSEAWFEAAQIMADGAEKLGRLQLETIKSLLREGAERGRGLGEIKNIADLRIGCASDQVDRCAWVKGSSPFI